MKNRAYKRQVKRIEDVRKRWQETLGLSAWSTSFVYHHTRKSYAKATGNDGRISEATCYCDWRYMTIRVHVNTPAWLVLSDWSTEQAVVHELIHALLDQLARAPKADKQAHLENTCTNIANAFVWARDRAVAAR